MKPAKPTPAHWPRFASAIFYAEPKRAIDWLCNAFGFEVRLLVDDGQGGVAHSELTYGDGLIMVGQAERKRAWCRSPRVLAGANTQSLMAYVDDADAHCAHARQHGAKILSEPTTVDYGPGYWIDRGYECEDLEGHHWWFMQRISDSPPAAK